MWICAEQIHVANWLNVGRPFGKLVAEVDFTCRPESHFTALQTSPSREANAKSGSALAASSNSLSLQLIELCSNDLPATISPCRARLCLSLSRARQVRRTYKLLMSDARCSLSFLFFSFPFFAARTMCSNTSTGKASLFGGRRIRCK